MIEVHEMQVFLAAAEEENFSAAARKLHLSQPAVSFQIQAIEQRLHIQLFQRTGRRITLSEAGRDLLPMAREIVNLSSRIEENLCAAQGLVKGHLVIGCTTSPGKYLLPSLIGAFRNQFPEVQFTVEVMSRENAEEKLLNKEIHIGVLSMPAKSRDLECWHLMTDELVLIVAADHPWAARRKVLPTEFKDAEWILREGTAPTRQLILAKLAEFELTDRDLRVAMELGSVEGVEAAVEAGFGVSIVSRIAVMRGLQLGRVRTVEVEGMRVAREIYLARNRLRACTCAQLRFREFVASAEGRQVIADITAVHEREPVSLSS
ncbi:MAG TPA: LysR substrate-binding domain-containing protein [Anaerolineae bacterium]